jgi:hypothetical protein
MDAVVIPALKFEIAVKVFVPLKVCVPASPASTVVYAGNVTVFPGTTGPYNIVCEAGPEDTFIPLLVYSEVAVLLVFVTVKEADEPEIV